VGHHNLSVVIGATARKLNLRVIFLAFGFSRPPKGPIYPARIGHCSIAYMTEQKILTVDDDKVIRLLVCTAFRAFACKVFEAGDGVEGLALADREHPDLILLDNDMPVMNGTEMLSRLKASPVTRNIPVLMLTADSRHDSVMRILKMGVKDYLVKPFTAERILERARRIIELRPLGELATGPKRSDDRIQILVVDKPAISQLIVKGFAGTPWQVHGVTQPGEALEACKRTTPDVLLVSLSLPGGAGFTLFRMLRTTPETKALPILGLSVKTAVAEQAKAHHLGFNAVVSKPIDLATLRHEIVRVLALDTSQRYFQHQDDALILTLPAGFSQLVASEIAGHLREKVCDAVDAGLSRFVIDLSRLRAVEVSVIKLSREAIQLCSEFGLSHGFTGSEAPSLIRALGLDISHRYFKQRDDTLLLTLPDHFDQFVADEITVCLRQKGSEAENAGLRRLVMDLSRLQTMDTKVINLGQEVVQLCSKYGLHQAFVGSEAVSRECANYQEAKGWKFADSFEKAIQGLEAKA